MSQGDADIESSFATRQLVRKQRIATLLDCSDRTVDRLDATGALGAAVQLLSEKRWRLRDVLAYRDQMKRAR